MPPNEPLSENPRADALRDLQDYLWLNGCQITLVDGSETLLQVLDLEDGKVSIIPRYISDLIEIWEPEIIESLAPPSKASIYAAKLLERATDRKYGTPVPAGETVPDAFAEPAPVDVPENKFF